ncbi:MAG TPA: flagellar biosynthetic protein FliO [Chloroflexota bacterium]|nr:flagellar biosynthetic protein FliO [Chloroflexota bacterium]
MVPTLLRRLTGSRYGLVGLAAGLVLFVALTQSPLLKGALAPAASAFPAAAASPTAPAERAVSGTSPAAVTAQAPAPAASAPAQVGAPASPAGGSPAASPVATPASFLPAYQDPQATPTPNGLLTFLSLGLKLVIVLVLIYATVLGLKWLNGRTARTFAGHTNMRVLESNRLGPNRDVYLLEVADRVLVIGATGSSMNVLSEITDSGALDLMREKPEAPLAAAEPFLNYLRGVGEKLSGKREPLELGRLLDEEPGRTALPTLARASDNTAGQTSKPADLTARIEASRRLIRERTLAIQESGVGGSLGELGLAE